MHSLDPPTAPLGKTPTARNCKLQGAQGSLLTPYKRLFRVKPPHAASRKRKLQASLLSPYPLSGTNPASRASRKIMNVHPT